ncbi:MAG: formylglycine-generating enzyme family protein [Muribaculaceae bacterium]|nr:formylglycine-generating enzyme family protein [Muribaculaceae bacterium]
MKNINLMKGIKNIYTVAAGLLLATSLSGCSSPDEPMPGNESTENKDVHTCEMTFTGNRPSFDAGTRADEGWKDGDKLYLALGEEFTIHGTAEYYQGKWVVNYAGTLAEGEEGLCKVVYIDNPDWTNAWVVSMNEQSSVYETMEGTYKFADGKLSVTAVLTPKTGRIRFAGENGEKVIVAGISYYSSFDCATGKFVKSSIVCQETIANGYTPYIYGEFTTPEKPYLTLMTADNAFSRRPGAAMLNAGESGYMTIPSETAHIGWQNAAVFSVNGVEFVMIPVKYDKGNYMLAQTETTTQLYNAVNNSSSTSLTPYSGIATETWLAWLESLNTQTGLKTVVPTLDQWQYAYKGGSLSRGYLYSGSNTIGEVAWYRGNASSNKHYVGSLQPNELGFYDMSGNVAELVSDGEEETGYYYYGGYYGSYADQCLVSSQLNTSYTDYSGLRFAMNFEDEK